jgi:caa(3)-type oxidase subunit IV
LKPAAASGIALIKTCIVYWFLMELRVHPGLTRLFAISTFAWLLLLVSIPLIQLTGTE